MKCVCCGDELVPESSAAKHHLCWNCALNIGKGRIVCHENQVPLVLARIKAAKGDA
ncbi:hypothetical protein LCGC14_1393850 [marine sediment metagenome]|uniref:Uncharacterized protein n=1 Tax=marine sediment metagenome TaxID=412755 RepID=A0A0F9JZA5_9ZZZZ